MVTIGVDQSLIKSSMYEHIRLENIYKLYNYDGISNYQQQQ